MYEPILATKLYIPKPGAHLVHRPRLIARLEESLAVKMSLLSAPPGFGKSTLLADWLNRKSHPAGWLSLDERDNDPVRFLSYLFKALQKIRIAASPLQVGQIPLAMLQSQQPARYEAALTVLINELVESPQLDGPYSDPIILVLDDYHVIEVQEIHDLLAFFVDYQPPRLHLVIASRTDPDLPLPRLRIRGEMRELRAADLRFSDDEIDAFLRETAGLILPAGDITALASRTEGWAAGLQVAALSMKGQEDVSAFIQAFTGSNRYILEFLIEEVLDRQPAEIQSFLLRTSVLDRLYGPLCDALTGQSDGIQTLETLDQANLFLVHLDDQRAWYRYQQLFAQFLRSHLAMIEPDILPELHQRAAGWLAANDLPAEAVSHALAAGDHDLAGSLIEGVARETIRLGEWGTLQRWLDALPPEQVRSSSGLCLAQAWALLFTGTGERTEQWLQLAEASGMESGDADNRGEINAIRASLAAIEGDTDKTIALGEIALASLKAEELFLRTVVIMAMGYAYRYNGDVPAAIQTFEQAVVLSQLANNRYQELDSLCNLVNVTSLQGRRHRAEETITRAEQITILPNGKPSAIASEVYLIKAVMAYEQNELAAAEERIKESLLLNSHQGISELEYAAYIWLAIVKRAQGDLPAAQGHMQHAEQLAYLSGNWRNIAHAAAVKAQLAHYQGDSTAAVRWAEQVPADRQERPLSLPRINEFEYTIQAQILIAQGRAAEALSLLAPRIETARSAGRLDTVYKMMIFQALALEETGERERASSILGELLSLTAPEGYIRLYLDAGQDMVAMLQRAVRSGIEPIYVRAILQAFAAEPGAVPAEAPTPLDAPLSERELEVLNLIAAGYANKEIAAELVISLGTVKRHISNIYNKLETGSRTQAIARGRELQLIS